VKYSDVFSASSSADWSKSLSANSGPEGPAARSDSSSAVDPVLSDDHSFRHSGIASATATDSGSLSETDRSASGRSLIQIASASLLELPSVTPIIPEPDPEPATRILAPEFPQSAPVGVSVKNDTNGALSTGVVSLIVIATVLVIAAVIFALWLLTRKRANSSKSIHEVEMNNETAGAIGLWDIDPMTQLGMSDSHSESGEWYLGGNAIEERP
jgi:hypothetical protein